MREGYYLLEKVKVFGYELNHQCIVTTLQHPIRTFFIESGEITESPRDPVPVIEEPAEKKRPVCRQRRVPERKIPEDENYELFSLSSLCYPSNE